MRTPDTGPVSHSRRALLGGVAGLAVNQTLPSTALAAPSSAPLSVLTRNLYLGVDLSKLFDATSMNDVRHIAGEMLDEIRAHPYEARVDAIAAEIETSQPDVVGVQEAAHLRVQTESDFSESPIPNASTTVVDLLDLLASALDDRGLSYDVAAETVTTDIEVPADDDGGTTDVRLTDRTALLVRSDLETTGSRSETFDNALRYRVQGATVPIQRGFCQVDLSLDGADVAVASAHLESADDDTRLDQAEELRDELPTDRPVVLAGDLNSGPGGPTAAYDLLTESFVDPASDSESDAADPTCCQASDLRNETSDLSRRVDHVLSRGDVDPTGVQRVGADPDSRVTTAVDGESVELWPADHAGVVASFAVPTPTPTPTATPTRTQTATETERQEPEDSANLPLYGTVAGIGSAALAALVWYRKRR